MDIQAQRPLLIGYVRSQYLSEVTEQDARALDIINIAGGHIKDGLCVWPDGEGAELQAGLQRLRAYKPELKFVLSIGGLSTGGFSEAAASMESRERFAKSAAELIFRHELDGIDIDWEYPGISLMGTDSNPADKENFTFFLQAIRTVLDTHEEPLLLTIAAGGDAFFCRNTQMDKVSDLCDYVQIMTYDLRGAHSHATGHHTNLYIPQTDFLDAAVETAVEAFVKAGVPKEKIVIGAAFYSRMWKDVPAVDKGYNKVAESIGDYGPGYDELVDRYIGPEGEGINGYKRYWDESAQAPWLFNGDEFITYDDPQSIRAKVQYLKEEGLLGIMSWEYSLAMKHSLTRVAREAIDEA